MGYWLDAAWQLLLREVRDWLIDLFAFRYVAAAGHWFNVKLYIQSIAFLITSEIGAKAKKVTDALEDYADDIVESLEKWATAAVTNIETSVNSILNTISNVWGSITAIWTRFGADLLNTSKSVVQWVDEKIDTAIEGIEGITTEVMSWITGAWAWVRDKSADVTAWIDEKSGDVWDWIIGAGADVKDWYDEQHTWLSDLYTNKREELADFLDDPGRYIADWVVDSLEYIVAECVFRFW